MFRILIVILSLSCLVPQAGAAPVFVCKGKECDEDQRLSGNRVSPMQEETLVEPKLIETPPSSVQVPAQAARKAKTVHKKVNAILRVNPEIEQPSSNLPPHLLARTLTGYQLEGKPTLVASKEPVEGLGDLHMGDIAHALIEQAITVSPSISAPIRAEILDGRAKGFILIGEATLGRELKWIQLQFQKLRDVQTNDLYELKASGLSPSGEAGLAGEYHSQDGKFFLTQLLTAGIAGFADATIDRSQNNLGNFVEKPGLDTAAKKGLVSAFSETSQRMSERAKNAPEYTHLEGYQIIPILIMEEPVKKRR